MDEKEFFYLDRPSVPVTHQVITDPEVFVEQGALVSLGDLTDHEDVYAMEVKDDEGLVVGTVLYADGFSLQGLIGGYVDELVEAMEDEIDVDDVDSEEDETLGLE